MVLEYAWYRGWIGQEPSAADPAGIEADLIEELRTAIGRLPRGISVTWLVRRAPVGRALLEEASARACDAIVIGASRGIWSRLTGGVAGELRRGGEIPVIVVGSARRRRARRAEPRRPGSGGRMRARAA
jgi:nucleotide-binding universal stress UspA family protein